MSRGPRGGLHHTTRPVPGRCSSTSRDLPRKEAFAIDTASVIIQQRPPDWRQDASCSSLGPELFHGSLPQMREAQQVCARCPVAELCLWTCLVYEDPPHRSGVWGGLLPGQRDQLAALCDHDQALELLRLEETWWAAGRRATA